MNDENITATKAPRRLSLLLGALLAASVLLCVGASSASAVLLGINEGGSETERDMEAIGRSGANVYQMGIVWHAVSEHGNWRESPAWEATIDKRVELAAKNGVNLIGGLYGRQTVAALHQYYLSNEWGEYMEFVWTVVQRYGRGGAFWSAHPTLPYRPITIWTVWNEPNLAWNNPGETVLPQKYAEFLIATSNTIKAAQNAIRKAGEPVDTKVIHAGLYQPDLGTAVGTFIEKASKVSGYAASFDGMGLHPYSFAGTEAEKLAGLATNIEKARNAVNNWVGTAKPIWISELGWPLAGTKEPSVSEAEQARLLTASFNWLKANAAANKIELITWFLYSDIETETWDGHCGLRSASGKFRASWYAFQEETGARKWPLEYPDELGFIRYNSAQTHLDTYVGGPTYKTLGSSSETGYPKITDPQNIQGMAIDPDGDGIDDLGFLRYNPAGNKAILDDYAQPPNYNQLVGHCETGYPKITDPQNVQSFPISWNGELGDELGFVRFNTASGKTHLDTYTGACYNTLASSSDTGYPAITDPENVQAVPIDINGDGIDELAFVRLKGASTTMISVYEGAPNYQKGILTCSTGYPAVSDPQNVQAMAVDWNGDRVDELGFLRFNPGTLSSHLDTYTSAPCYNTLASNSDVGYPKVTDPQNLQALSLNWNKDPYSPPGEWNTENLGGTLSSDPDISSWGPGRLDVFARGSSNGLSHRAFSSTSWFPWESLGGGTLNSGPGAVSWGPGRIDTVARSSNDTIQHWWFDGTSFPFDNLGQPSSGPLTSDPDISSWGAGRLDVFARGTDNALWHKAWSSTAWFPWEKLGGTLTSGPGAVSWGPERIDIVARTTGNSVQHWYFNGSQFLSDNLGGNITSAPDISSWGPNRLDVFARGPENGLIHKYWNGSSWSEWESLGGPALEGGPAAVSWGNKRIDVVARIAGNSIHHWYYTAP